MEQFLKSTIILIQIAKGVTWQGQRLQKWYNRNIKILKQILTNFKAIVNFFCYEKKDLNSLWKKSLHCPIQEKLLILKIYFSFYHSIPVLTSLYKSKASFLFNGVLDVPEIPKELIILCVGYNVALRLENFKSQN